jgi:hypothetical protein
LTTRPSPWTLTLPGSVHRTFGWHPTTRPGLGTRPESSVRANPLRKQVVRAAMLTTSVRPRGTPAKTDQVARRLRDFSAREKRRTRDVRELIGLSGDRPRTVQPTAQSIRCKITSAM